jgi:8-oxo-dGTP pyrophosphatase MutT (NUDIX family)
MIYSLFCKELIKSYHQGLPGTEAQLQMAPLQRKENSNNYFLKNNSKQSAVTVLWFESESIPHLLLTQRTAQLKHHGNQISFPGGRKDDQDASLIDTALRELKEEVGVAASEVNLVGDLTSLYIPVSNYFVQPFLAVASERINFSINTSEVQAVIKLPIFDLIDDKRIAQESIKLGNGLLQKVPAFKIDNKIIWGATAMILSEVKAIVKRIYD